VFLGEIKIMFGLHKVFRQLRFAWLKRKKFRTEQERFLGQMTQYIDNTTLPYREFLTERRGKKVVALYLEVHVGAELDVEPIAICSLFLRRSDNGKLLYCVEVERPRRGLKVHDSVQEAKDYVLKVLNLFGASLRKTA
jgi:hypothetical protein